MISAGTGSGHELFRIADTHRLRVYVQVPQTYASAIRPDMVGELTVPEQPGQSFPAMVIATANAIDETSRTLLVQLEADNAAGRLAAGSYAEVRFDLPPPSGVVQLPVSALLFRRHGLKVATVDNDNRVVLKSIQIGRDYGTRVEVVTGLRATDRVIDSPPDWLGDGDVVRVAPSDPAPAKPLAAVVSPKP